ncbi:MAG: histidine kinase [Saprospiraceae bacterium]
MAFVMPTLLFAILIWFFLSYQKRKFLSENEQKDALLREHKLRIENQEAIEHERNRIASEMHDELGSGLTIIQYLSADIDAYASDEKIKDGIHKISTYSATLVRNMSEIIWAMNSRFDNLEGLISYLRHYIGEYMEDHQMDHSFHIEVIDPDINISGEKRRNLYLVVKELLHNSVKYSKASKIVIDVTGLEELEICVTEIGGVGFDHQAMTKNGNGLFNIDKRMKQINGNIKFEKVKNDMCICIKMPLVIENNIKTLIT